MDTALGGGMRRGDLVVLGGTTGAGKSSLALAFALRMAQSAVDVSFFSHEMTTERLLERALAMEGRCRVDDLRAGALTDEARTTVAAAAVRLRERLPRLETMTEGGTARLAAALRERSGLQVAFVDPLQALTVDRSALDEEIASATLALKRLALELDMAVVATAQTVPATSARDDQRPSLDDFGARGALRQHADVVLGLYREEMLRPASGAAGATELHILKNRNGRPGYVDLYFYEQYMRFEDLLEPDR